MKASSTFAVVLPLVIGSCIADGGPAGHSRAERAAPPEESRAAIGALVAAHNDTLSQMRNSGGPVPPSSVNCN